MDWDGEASLEDLVPEVDHGRGSGGEPAEDEAMVDSARLESDSGSDSSVGSETWLEIIVDPIERNRMLTSHRHLRRQRLREHGFYSEVLI